MIKLSRREKRFIVIVSLLLIVITSFNYCLGWLIGENTENRYLGTNQRYREDVSVYISYIEQAKEGNILFENLYSSEPQPKLFLAPLWLVIGWLAVIFHLPSLLAFHLVRIILIPILVWLAYLFLARIFRSVHKRITAALIFFFSGGFGFFFLSRYFTSPESKPIDLWLPESNSFLTIYHSPHWLLALILILAVYQLLLVNLDKKGIKPFVLASFLTILLGVIHPYDLIVIVPVYGYVILHKTLKERIFWPNLLKYIIFLIIAGMPLLYFFLLRNFDPVFSGWFSQNVTFSAKISSTILGYGLVFILMLIGFYRFFRDLAKKPYRYFIVVWLLINFSLLYFPNVLVQRRLVLGMLFPLSVLATEGIWLINQKLEAIKQFQIKKIFLITLAIVLPITNLLVLTLDFSSILTYHDLPFYLEKDYVEALAYLEKETDYEATILADYYVSNAIPGQIAHKVYSGHPHQTIHYEEKKELVTSFYFTNTQDYLKKTWLNQSGIKYVIVGPHEVKWQNKKIAKGMSLFKADEKYYLDRVFENETVSIYEVI